MSWMWFIFAMSALAAALIAFKIAHETHRRNSAADNRTINDAALGGDEKTIEAVGNALSKVATARGQAPRWRPRVQSLRISLGGRRSGSMKRELAEPPVQPGDVGGRPYPST